MGRYTKADLEAEAVRVGVEPDPAAKPAEKADAHKQVAKPANKAVKAAANKQV
jgi:hypothetical protein